MTGSQTTTYIVSIDYEDYPCDLKQLFAWAREGRVLPSHQVWNSTIQTWQPAGCIPEISDAFSGLPQCPYCQFPHTFTTRALESGLDIRTIMAITGHKDASMFQRYSHPSDSHLKTAVESLSGHTGGHTASVSQKESA